MKSADASRGRDDISQFVVHLTRDDSKDFKDGGSSARDNFLRILKERFVGAFKAHCLFNPLLGEVDEAVKKRFHVACFTETPLNQIHLLVRRIAGRSVVFEPYGFCFRKQFLVEKGAQQAIYINSYVANNDLKSAAMSLYSRCKQNDFKDPEWRLLPFVNAMHEQYDFSWEREWRLRGPLKFKHSDLVCVILPDEGEDELKEYCAKKGLAAISPGWRYEDIVSELAKQQKATRKAWKTVLEQPTK